MTGKQPRLLLPTSAHQLANSLVLSFLHESGYSDIAAGFREQVDSAGEQFYIAHDSDVNAGTREWQDARESEGKRVFERTVPSLLRVVDEWQTDRMLARQRINSIPFDNCLSDIKDATYPTNMRTKLIAIHTQNILVVQLHCFQSDITNTLTEFTSQSPLLLTTGSDKTLCLTTYPHGESIRVYRDLHTGPILSVSRHSRNQYMFVTGSMDGSVCLLDLRREIEQDSIVEKWKAHEKYVTVVTVAPNGSTFLSAGYDRRLNIYKLQENSDTVDTLKHSLLFSHILPGPIESVVYTNDSRFIIVSCRHSHHLHIVDIHTDIDVPTVILHNLNASLHDTYLSYTPMHLAVSPSGRYLAMATSAPSGRIILFQLTTMDNDTVSDNHEIENNNYNKGSDHVGTKTLQLTEIRNFYGCRVDEYSKRRIAWLGSDHYLASNSDDYAIYIYATYPVLDNALDVTVSTLDSSDVDLTQYMHTTNTQIVTKLYGHEHVVRDLWWASEKKVLVSGGYDKNVISWE